MSGGQSAGPQSIGFACDHCGQKLTVSVNRVGQRGQCPKCRRPVVVPNKLSESPESARPTATSSPPPESLASVEPRREVLEVIPPPVPVTDRKVDTESDVSSDVGESPGGSRATDSSPMVPEWMQGGRRDESPWIFAESRPDDPVPPPTAAIDASRVNLPRYVLFSQGIALGVVALVSFALGLLAGNSGRHPTGDSRVAAAPCVVSGVVEYVTSGGSKFPDEGAVVLLFPQNERPDSDERSPVAGLRPQDPSPTSAMPSLKVLQQMGAFHVRADRSGQFRIPLARGGKYHLLVVSHHGARRPGREASRADLAAIGRYVNPPDELLGDRRYRWRTEDFQRDTELSVVLD